MIDHIWTVICAKSIIDNESNNFSLIEALEQFNVTAPKPEGDKVGVIVFDFEVVSLWSRADYNIPCKGKAKLIYKGTSDEIIQETEYSIDLSSSKRHRTRLKFQSLPVKGPGKHFFCVQLQWEGLGHWMDVSKLPLEVVFTK